MFDYLANPSRFMRLANRVFGLGISCSDHRAGWALSRFGYLTTRHQQGETVRIIYIHVPAAWLALFGYVGLGMCGIFYIVWRHPLADVAACGHPVGAVFTLLTLITRIRCGVKADGAPGGSGMPA